MPGRSMDPKMKRGPLKKAEGGSVYEKSREAFNDARDRARKLANGVALWGNKEKQEYDATVDEMKENNRFTREQMKNDAAKRRDTGFKKGGAIVGKKHTDAAMDAAMVKKMVKPSAMKAKGGPMKYAGGGAAGVRKGSATADGMPKKAPGGRKLSDCI